MRYALAIAAMSGALSIIPAGVSAAAAPAPSFLDDGARTAIDQMLMLILSACVLQDRFKLAS